MFKLHDKTDIKQQNPIFKCRTPSRTSSTPLTKNVCQKPTKDEISGTHSRNIGCKRDKDLDFKKC